MDLVIGGAYQGKELFVKENLFHDQAYKKIPFSSLSQMVIQGLEGNLLISHAHEGIQSTDELEGIEKKLDLLLEVELEVKGYFVIVGDQIGDGLVPMDPQDRMWRDSVGFMYQRIGKKAKSVYRIWAGLGEKIK